MFTFNVLPMATVALDGVRYMVADAAADDFDISSKGVAATSNTVIIRIMRFTINTIISYQSA
jgi:hypothetical protein